MLYKDMLARAMKSKEIKMLTPLYFEWEKAGDQVVGKFVGASEVSSGLSEGTYKQYLIETDDGLVKFALGTATDREVEPLLETGHVYVFTYRGKEELSGGRRVNKFLIEEIMNVELVKHDSGINESVEK